MGKETIKRSKIMKAIFILEGVLDESHQSELSKAVDVLAKDFGLESYLDDVIEDEIVRKCEGCTSRQKQPKRKRTAHQP